ncbi:hypothetical protein [Bacillus nitratireducens]|uniref:hypothetical protein n=1 Tax=Bacillus nitratireducens TaxID=2026193 RepID=UPI002E1E7648|nr:hypothetical protein [Bacillus nitratireducens]
MNQLSFFEDIDEKEMRRFVVKELKNYKALCVRMKNQEERAQAGGVVLFPKMNDDDKNLYALVIPQESYVSARIVKLNSSGTEIFNLSFTDMGDTTELALNDSYLLER